MARISWLVPPPVAPRPPRAAHVTPHPTRYHRTVFISDVHLGTRGCKAELLLDFLQKNACQTLYLIGDIVDGWQLKRRWYWPQAHSEVVHEILRKVDEGTRVIFVPGNHDEFLRGFCGRNYAGIEVVRETIHETGDGKRLLVLHGDQFDGVIEFAKWLAHLGSWAYDQVLRVNEVMHTVRRAFGLPYWSLSNWLKHAVKDAVEYVCRFEEVVARAAASRGLDGWFAAISTRPPCAGSATSSTSTMETGLKAAQPLSKMPTDIWRSFVGPLLFQPRPLEPRPPAKPRLYPRRVRRVWPGAVRPLGRFPVPGKEHLKILIVTDAWKPQVNGVVTTLEMLAASSPPWATRSAMPRRSAASACRCRPIPR